MTEGSEEERQQEDLFALRRDEEYRSAEDFCAALKKRRHEWLMFCLMNADRVYEYGIEARLREKMPAGNGHHEHVSSCIDGAIYCLAYDGFYAGMWRDFGGEKQARELFKPLHPFVLLTGEDEKRFSLSRYELSFLEDHRTITKGEVERWFQTIEFLQGPITWRPQALAPFLFAGHFSLFPFDSMAAAQKRVTFDRKRKRGFGGEGDFLVQKPYSIRNLRIGTSEINHWYAEIRRWGTMSFRRLLHMGRLPGEVGKQPVRKGEDPRYALSVIRNLVVQDPGAVIVSTGLHYWKARHLTPPTSISEGMFLFDGTFCQDERDRFNEVGRLVTEKRLVLGVYRLEQPCVRNYNAFQVM